MAYMSQERKKELVNLAKVVLKKYGVKATFGVRHHSTIVCKIKSGKLDLMKDYCGRNADLVEYINVNPYHFRDYFQGRSRDFITDLMGALNTGNWDKSDIQTDYFDKGWYVDVSIGNWKKPYKVAE